MTYFVSHTSGEFSTTSKKTAAEVAVAWKKNNLSPSLYVVRDGDTGIETKKVDVSSSIAATLAAMK